MNLRILYSRSTALNLRGQSSFKRCFATTTKETDNEVFDVSTVDETPIYVEEVEKDDALEKRNKSRLGTNHRNILHGIRPYEKSMEWYHDTTRYKRRLLGRFGMESLDVPVGVVWPMPAEVEDEKEYERVGYPDTIQECWAKIAKKHANEAEAIRAREEQIATNLSKLEYWKTELAERLAKKEAQVLAAKKRKERLVEEVRRHFGFTVDPRSEKFKEMLEQREKEERKRNKQAKKKAMEERMMAKLMTKSNATSSSPSSKKPENTSKDNKPESTTEDKKTTE